MKPLIHFILLIIILLINQIIAEEEDINQLFCQLNEYAKLRVHNNQNVFPCQDS